MYNKQKILIYVREFQKKCYKAYIFINKEINNM